MKTQKYYLAVLMISVSLYFGCKKDDSGSSDTPDNNPPAQGSNLTGSWTGGGGIAEWNIIFQGDTGYQFRTNGVSMESGLYAVSNNRITLTPKASMTCNIGRQAGVYTYDVTSNSLKFTKVQDSCSYRASIMAMSFSK